MLWKRSFDLLMDQGETASVERPFAASHLQNTVSLGKKRGRDGSPLAFRGANKIYGPEMLSVALQLVMKRAHLRGLI